MQKFDTILKKMNMGVYMRILLVIIFLNISLFACEGDCMACHPGLLKDGKLDKKHQVLKTCVTCHTKEQMSKIDMGGGCGQDCWECHDVKKVAASGIKEHAGLEQCITCHVKLKKEGFMIEYKSSPSSGQPITLDSLLFK